METKLAELRDFEQLSSSIETAKDIITRDYLYQLGEYQVCTVPRELRGLEISEYTRFYKFKRFISDKKENTIDKLVTVFNAAYTSRATVVTLVKGHDSYTDYYIGIVSKDFEQESCDIGTQGETFKGVLTGNFPGLEIEQVMDEDIRKLCGQVFECDYITAISGIASIRKEKESDFEKYVQGIEHLVDSMDGREYSILVIADPVSTADLALARSGYEQLYTQMSPFLKTSLSFNETESFTVTRSHTESITKSIGESTSFTQNYSVNSGWNKSYNQGTNKNKNIGGMVGAIAGVGIGLIMGPPGAILGSIAGQIGAGLIGFEGENTGEGSGINENTGRAVGRAEGKNLNTAVQKGDTDSQAEGHSHGRTMQVANENKTVKSLLDKIDKHIERLNKCEAYGAFNCATYVMSPDPETNEIVSNGYNALMRGDSSALQASYINTWSMTNPGMNAIRDYLKKFSHPLFTKDRYSHVVVSPASLANSYELAVNIGLPKKSISGLPVFEMAAFGRNVYEMDRSDALRGQIHLGQIYHMGSPEKNSVELDVKSLAMHTFITGSTGSGKSNTIYQLLRELRKQEIRFLVIEPAKGEYKHIFGNDGAKVYGTNPYYTSLLKINPFRFPKEIHVLEHIDRLIEIFNVCWPMYAAMPAVLKDSVERAYIGAGWDLSASVNRYSAELFPTFRDVLIELNKVVGESAFSQEVKDNYIGSLSTRIKSLTNGIYGRIFENKEYGDAVLFDENVIIDLSRIGSIETKSMIMGILVMRLQEYRMTSARMNADLHHVTILEEAHNLLKRTSVEQSSESSNLLGKSVEMLANAIAEMRTYGEGFIIADQAPGLLDMSVIRNTNTKIIMRLPDAEDRNLVGKSANLSENQIRELAKLPTGIAAVYQNNWLEPVLCQVRYKRADGFYQLKENKMEYVSNGKAIILNGLLDKAAGEKLDMNIAEMTRYITESPLSTDIKTTIINLIRRNGSVKVEDISAIVYDLICTAKVIEEIEQEEYIGIEELKDIYIYSEDSVVAGLEEEKQNVIVECILRENVMKHKWPEECLERWYEYTKGGVM